MADATDLKSVGEILVGSSPTPGTIKIEHNIAMFYLIVILGYLLGSIPTAYIAGRLIKGRDIREMGDGNVGAQNAFRQLGARIGVTVGIVDVGKGALAILIAQAVNIPQLAILATGAAAIIGHNWPVFIGFKGGRGEATTIGVLLILVTQPMLILGAMAAAVLIKTKNVVLASVVLFLPLSLVSWWLGVSGGLVAYSIGLPCLVGLTHYVRIRQKLMHPA